MRKVLWILVWVAVTSLGIAVRGIGFEAKQVTVELVYDFRSLEHLADLMGGDIKASARSAGQGWCYRWLRTISEAL